MGSRDHRFVDDGDGGIRPLATGQRKLRLGEGLAHEQLVIHCRMLADVHPRSASHGALRNPPATRRAHPAR
jgi:hypothetical protein